MVVAAMSELVEIARGKVVVSETRGIDWIDDFGGNPRKYLSTEIVAESAGSEVRFVWRYSNDPPVVGDVLTVRIYREDGDD